MNFAQAVAANRAPGKTVVLEPWAFEDEWHKKPTSAVCAGLRLLADKEKTRARLTAQEMTNEHHDGERGKAGDFEFQAIWVETYNDTLMRQVVAMALCDPNDVKKPFEIMPIAEIEISDALTSRGVEHVFRALARYEIESSAVVAPAAAEELELLAKLLPLVRLERLPVSLRRLITDVTNELDLAFGDGLVDADAVDDTSKKTPLVIGQKRLVGDAVGA